MKSYSHRILHIQVVNLQGEKSDIFSDLRGKLSGKELQIFPEIKVVNIREENADIL